jgi:predicted transcriptional regulator
MGQTYDRGVLNMGKGTLPELTVNELAFLKLLWKEGSLSAREIHKSLDSKFEWSYSTTRTLLERMVKKDLLKKEAFHGIFLYTPAISKARGLAQTVRHFAENVLEMELAPVVNLFTGGQALSAKEIEELQHILETELGKDQ